MLKEKIGAINELVDYIANEVKVKGCTKPEELFGVAIGVLCYEIIELNFANKELVRRVYDLEFAARDTDETSV